MSRLEESRLRLSRALTRVREAAEGAQSRLAAKAASPGEAAVEEGDQGAVIADLTRERDELVRQNEALEKLARDLGGEIDRAIEEVRNVLET
ncbi:MAG: hypothetical protein AAGF19_01380 [Pseudomonadota bacterium]